MARPPAARRVSRPDGDLPLGRLVAVHREGAAVREPVYLEPGSLRETLVVLGPPLEELPPGTRLRVGAAAVVELVGDPGPSGDTASSGGLRVGPGAGPRIPARVIAVGTVRAGDPVVLEAVRVPLEDALDLHPFRPDEVADVVREYLEAARAAGLGEVRVVHGRGLGIQRATVRRVLAASPLVVAFADALPERGGWGATIVRLRPASGPPSP